MHVLGCIVIAALTCTFTRATAEVVDGRGGFRVSGDLGIRVLGRIR